MSSISSGYKEPEWAVQPSSSVWALAEIKGGVEVAKHDLSNRATTILGRAVGQVHVPLHHESISRQHARISFDSRGNPWLRDLQSAHGTTVNKRRLPTAAIGKAESNSRQKGARGIMLSVGDIMRFGASSRYFSLEGPAPLVEPTEKEKLLAKVNKSSTTSSLDSEPSETTKNAAHGSKNEGVSWGISMDEGCDDVHGDAGHGNITNNRHIALDPLKIPDKYRKELDKLNALKYKLTNLETEDNRIRRKGELTEGQQKQLDRNAERENNLRECIREQEDRLHNKLNGRSSGGSSKGNNARIHESSYDDEDDDYFDRTKSNSRNGDGDVLYSPTDEAESEETLTAKWKKRFHEQKHLKTVALEKASHRVATLTDELEAMRASGDEEAFFVQNDLQLAVESKKKLDSSLAKNNTIMHEIEKLLKVVNPKIHCDRTIGYIGEGQPRSQPQLLSPSLESNQRETTERETDESRSTMKPPRMVPTKQNSPLATVAAKGETPRDDKSMPPPQLAKNELAKTEPSQFPMPAPVKRKRVLGPAEAPPSKSSRSTSVSSGVSHDNLPTSKGKRVGTLSFLNHNPTSRKLNDATKNDTTKNPNNKKWEDGKEQTQTASQLQSVIDTKSDVWRAPEGQDGSGKTKLNKKFEGRY